MTDQASPSVEHEARSARPHAIAVFHDQGAGFWPRLFGRPGFRHCFVALNDGRAWIVVDPCGDGMCVHADVSAETDLGAHYRDLGYAVIETAVSNSRRRYGLPWAFTCVEAVKRVLGVHGWSLWTPYQLYRRLEKENHGKHLQPAQAESPDAASAAAHSGRSGHRGSAQARA